MSLGAKITPNREIWQLPSLQTLVIGFAAGIGAYHALPSEPSVLALVALGVMIGFLIWLVAKLGPPRPVLWGLILALIGVLAGATETHVKSTQMISSPQPAMWVKGRLIEIEWQDGGDERLSLVDVDYPGMYQGIKPDTIRVNLRTGGDIHHVGDYVRMRVVLMPPGGPVYPGGFDFARHAWFQGLGAVGFAVTGLEVVEPGGGQYWLQTFRGDVGRTIRRELGGQTGAVASALLTGDRSGISEHTNAVMRDSGLAHLLAISGLHMALFAGSLFFAIRAVLAAWPWLALTYNIKKISAVVAWAGGLFYLLLSGAGISTQRAFIMLSLMLLAILLDRRAISLRNVALAAFVVLILSPSALLSVGFQMSFAAVVGLVAVYEQWRQYRLAHPIKRSIFRRIFAYPAGVMASTVIAETAILPIAVYHFHRFASFGLAANLLAIPLTGFLIMPFGLLALILMPFGLAGWALYPMGVGIDAMLGIAERVSNMPGAHFNIPDLGLGAFLLFMAGLAIVALGDDMRRRITGLVFIVVGIVIYLNQDRPDVIISPDGRMHAVLGDDGRYYFSSLVRERFARMNWQDRFAQEDSPKTSELPIDEDKSNHEKNIYKCDELGCIYKRGGNLVAFPNNMQAFYQDCLRADLIILADDFPIRDLDAHCNTRVLPMGAEANGQSPGAPGATAIWLDESGEMDVLSVRDLRGTRPWSRIPDCDCPLETETGANNAAEAQQAALVPAPG